MKLAEPGSDVAESLGIPFVEIEVVSSDEREHRHRIATRLTDIPGFASLTWDEVKIRQYDVWDRDHIIIDTAHQTVAESLMTLHEKLDQERRKFN